ncbi:GtrA family protein [Terrabacter carboxydivorans]|uniref:GtrA/DPMS transmembrane domain-containing protein n=1 Tax=Terrabacter carboxydivorans TaxID=619730 RepID=A0ABP5YJ53_9MICO
MSTPMSTPTSAPLSSRRLRLSQQVIRFAGVGLLSTALHLGLFAALVRGGAPSQVANGVALVLATLFNTALNRAWTFGISGRRRLVSHHGQALVIFAITYAATTVALAVLGAVAPDAGTVTQTVVVAVANVLSTAARFVAMQRWIFRTPTDVAAAPVGTTAPADAPTDRHDPAYVVEGVLEGQQREG